MSSSLETNESATTSLQPPNQKCISYGEPGRIFAATDFCQASSNTVRLESIHLDKMQQNNVKTYVFHAEITLMNEINLMC